MSRAMCGCRRTTCHKKEERNCFLRHFQQLRSYCDEFEITKPRRNFNFSCRSILDTTPQCTFKRPGQRTYWDLADTNDSKMKPTNWPSHQ